MRGTIIKGVGGLYFVKADDSKTYECRARGIFRKEKIKPMIGDRVEIDIDGENGIICEIEKRKSELVRPPVANIDTLAAVSSSADPEPDFYLIDKLLIMSEVRGITPIICITKTDLNSPDSVMEVYKNTGYRIFSVCSKTNEGIDVLADFLKGKTTAFAGLSGVGKSSLLNHIVDRELKTGEISAKISRGKHTTRHVELFETGDGGFVLDTPGFSSFEPDSIKESELAECFPEMRKYNNQCRFNGCSHTHEPECAVKDAVSDGLISKQRYDSYCRIYEILKNHKDWN